MSDDQDDILETGDLDSGIDDFGGGSSSLSGALKSNPIVKVGIVLGAFVLIVGGIILFGGKKEPIAESSMTSSAAELKQAPGMEKTSAVYEDAVKDVNEQNVERALREGGSAIPVPVGPSRGRVEVGNDSGPTEDPLERWRKIQEERLRKERQAQAVISQGTAEQPVDPNAEARQAMATAMATQMQSILDGLKITSMRSASITAADYFEKKRAAELEALKDAAAKDDVSGVTDQVAGKVLIEAGRIEYAQLIIEANTDSPGPVLAELASGPLAGSRMIGTFKATDEYLTLEFDTVVVDGIALTAEAIALDPSTSKPGMVTEIDHKYFQRIILPAAASFIEGIGGAIGESGSTTVSAGQGTTTSSSEDLDARQEFFKGVEKASEKLGEIIDRDGANVRPMLRLAAGTHLGILFTTSVVESTGLPADKPTPQEQSQTGQQGFQMPFFGSGYGSGQMQGVMPAQYPYPGQMASQPPAQQTGKTGAVGNMVGNMVGE